MKHIVIVEDDESVLELLQDILDSEGYESVGVTRPDDALMVARQRNPDLFLIDIMMPRRSGIEVAEELRVNGFAETPMIALSASSIMRDLAHHTGLFQGSLPKPFDVDRLVHTVMGYLRDAGRTPLTFDRRQVEA